jgi:hypothetical protein
VNALERLAGRLPLVEAAAVAGAAATLVGVAVAADALVAAARATPGAGELDWPGRLALGLWAFRIEHTLWLTLGALLLAWALARGAVLAGWRVPTARLVGGLLVGLVLVAGAIVLGTTYVALAGGAGDVTVEGRERLFTWLLQAATAAGGAVVWALLADRLGRVDEVPAAALDDERMEEHEYVEVLSRAAAYAPQEAEAPAVAQSRPAEPPPVPPAAPPPVPPAAPPPVAESAPAPPPPLARPVTANATPSPSAPPVRQSATLADTLEHVYRERLVYSPRRDEARRLIEQVARLEREGRDGEASRLGVQVRAL